MSDIDRIDMTAYSPDRDYMTTLPTAELNAMRLTILTQTATIHDLEAKIEEMKAGDK